MEAEQGLVAGSRPPRGLPAGAASDLAEETFLLALPLGVVEFSVLVGNAFGTLVLGAANAAISLALFASLVHPSAAAQTATMHANRPHTPVAILETVR